MKLLSLSELVVWLQNKVVAKENVKPPESSYVGDKYFSAEFTDGTQLFIESSYEEDWSDITPGAGLEFPHIWVKDA